MQDPIFCSCVLSRRQKAAVKANVWEIKQISRNYDDGKTLSLNKAKGGFLLITIWSEQLSI